MTLTLSISEILCLLAMAIYGILAWTFIERCKCHIEYVRDIERRLFRIEGICGLTHTFNDSDLELLKRRFMEAEYEKLRTFKSEPLRGTSPCSCNTASDTLSDSHIAGATLTSTMQMS